MNRRILMGWAGLFFLFSFSTGLTQENQEAPKAQEKGEVSDEFLYEEEPMTTLEQAQALLEKQSWNEALPLFQKVVDNPTDKLEYEQALFGMATCYEKLEKIDMAVRFYKTVVRQGQTEEMKEKARRRVDYFENYILNQFHIGNWYPKLWLHEKTETLAEKNPELAWHYRVGLPYVVLISYKFLLLFLFVVLMLAFTSAQAQSSPRRFDIQWGIPSVFGIYLCFLLLQLFMVFTLKPAFKAGGQDFLFLLFELILSYLILTALILLLLTWREIPWRKLGIDIEQFSRNMYLALKYIVVIVILFGLYAFLRSHEIIRQDKIIRSYPLSSVGTFLHLVQVFLLVIVSPIAEELFYRGFVYPVARNRTGILGGIVLTSLFFTLVHVDMKSLFILFFLSLALCYLYEKTRNIIPAICVHAFYNFIMLFGGSFLPSMEGAPILP